MTNPVKKTSEGISASPEEQFVPFFKPKSRYSVNEFKFDNKYPIIHSNISPRDNNSQLQITPVKIFNKNVNPTEQTNLPTFRQKVISNGLEQKDQSEHLTIRIKKKETLEIFKKTHFNNLGNDFIGRRSISEKKLRNASPRKGDESSVLIAQNPIYGLKVHLGMSTPVIDKKNSSDPGIFSSETDRLNFKEKSLIEQPMFFEGTTKGVSKRSPILNKEPVKSINPLYELNRTSNEKILLIKSNVNAFKKSIKEILFNESKSAEKLFNIIQDCSKGKEKKVLIDFLCDIYVDILKTKNRDKLNRVIALTISKSGNEKFFCSLVKDWRIDVNDFAKNVAMEFKKDSNLSPLFLPTLMRVTDYELKSQNPQTLFREQNFSSALCREYAGIVWGDELKQFCSGLSKKLEKIGPLNLCLMTQLIEEHLLKEDPSFKLLNYHLREKQIQKFLHSNLKSFKEFTQSILSEIFDMKISNEIKIMLICRRSQIIKFLSESSLQKNEKLEALSRTYISEVLILRILNPQIISLAQSNGQNPALRNVVINLSKIIQALGNQVPFNDENEDIVYQAFKDLYEFSIKDFCHFLDHCSSCKNEKEDK